MADNSVVGVDPGDAMVEVEDEDLPIMSFEDVMEKTPQVLNFVPPIVDDTLSINLDAIGIIVQASLGEINYPSKYYYHYQHYTLHHHHH